MTLRTVHATACICAGALLLCRWAAANFGASEGTLLMLWMWWAVPLLQYRTFGPGHRRT